MMDFSLTFFMAPILAGEERTLVVTSVPLIWFSGTFKPKLPSGLCLMRCISKLEQQLQSGTCAGPGGKAGPMACPGEILAEMMVWLLALSWPVLRCLLHSVLHERPSAAL